MLAVCDLSAIVDTSDTNVSQHTIAKSMIYFSLEKRSFANSIRFKN